MLLVAGLKNCLEDTVLNLEVGNHPYFSMLATGKMSKQQFLKTQIEFAPLVQFFNRPMAQVIANIPNPHLRMAIVENLWEEHGKGVIENIHGKTILTLIDRLGGECPEPSPGSLTSNVRIFNEALRGASAFEDYRFSVAMFGGIERTFVDISTIICRAIIDQEWLPADKITHYALHKEIDIQHAEDFLRVVNEDWQDATSQKIIKDGVEFGAHLFLSVYTGFYQSLVNGNKTTACVLI